MMKTICRMLWSSVLLVAFLERSQAAPPNDNFVDRIVLSGNSIAFDGTLVGATRERAGEQGEVRPPSGGWNGFYGTVWWSWTAEQSLPVTLTVKRMDAAPILDMADNTREFLNVFHPPDLTTGFPTNYCPGCTVAVLPLCFGDQGPNITFTSVAGATYYFQLTGIATNDFKLHLFATNDPVIVEKPGNLTVSPGASALFGVITVGVRPFGYQWQFNGTNLPGETSPMLALTNVSADHSGSYSVLVSNVTGTVLSDAAVLSVPMDENPPQLSVLGSSGASPFGFQLCGEAGRFYRVESSTNLQAWQAEKRFTDPRSQYFVSSVVFASNSCTALTIPAPPSLKFVRAVRYAPTNDVCNLRLKQVRFAKELWVRDGHWGAANYPPYSDLAPYFKNGQIDRCPSGGNYIFQWVYETPTCSLSGHALEEPR
ncbi:MAG TPA: immunoglobulin domain-containing protein [Verrucomicrobiae bacterium]|nr:immunoglobulin domain-containing protein [Verrucomicrobiae bacterium]